MFFQCDRGLKTMNHYRKEFRMKLRIVLPPLFFAALIAMALPASAQTTPAGPIKNIVLVHGAWADGSCWSKIIPRLEARGYHVVAVQNPEISAFAPPRAAMVARAGATPVRRVRQPCGSARPAS